MNYHLALPGGAHGVTVAREVVRFLLSEHQLGDLIPVAELTVSELMSCAYRFTPDGDASVSVRWRHGTLRLTVFDQHPTHTDRDLAERCRRRRCRSLGVLSALLRCCEGRWGLTDADEPLGGTRMWALLPREGARHYACV